MQAHPLASILLWVNPTTLIYFVRPSFTKWALLNFEWVM